MHSVLTCLSGRNYPLSARNTMSATSVLSSLRLQATEALERPSVAIAVGVVLLVLVANILSTIRQYRRLAHFKGPFQASLSKWWLVKTVGGRRAYLDFWEVTQRYGKPTFTTHALLTLVALSGDSFAHGPPCDTVACFLTGVHAT